METQLTRDPEILNIFMMKTEKKKMSRRNKLLEMKNHKLF